MIKYLEPSKTLQDSARALPSMECFTDALKSSTGESLESFLVLQLSQRYIYEHHKIIEVVLKITQDEVTSNLNLSIELNATIEIQETQVEEASIVI